MPNDLLKANIYFLKKPVVRRLARVLNLNITET